MKLPKLKDSEKYTGLYVFDFGDHTGVGFTAQEVAELFESQKYKDCKAYKIYKAYPDGRMELKGVPAETFQLETGMFFYSADLKTAGGDFERLKEMADKSPLPCRAKLHLAKYDEAGFVTALIFPAEYNEQISSWLLDRDYKTSGSAEAGTGAVQRYYERTIEILDRQQMFGKSRYTNRSGQELFRNISKTVQR